MAGQQRKCPYKRVRTLVVTKAEPLIPYLANTSIANASARNNHKFERGFSWKKQNRQINHIT